MMLEPKEITVTDQSGKERVYIIHKFPAVAGREIVTKYPLSNIPRVAEYGQSEEVMFKLMAYVGVPVAGNPQPTMLTTRALVDNHMPDWETLMKVEMAVLEYNVSFFGKGAISGFFESISPKVAAWISKTLIPSLVASLQTEKPPSGNSKRRTP